MFLKTQQDSGGEPRTFLGIERIPLNGLAKQIAGLKPKLQLPVELVAAVHTKIHKTRHAHIDIPGGNFL